MVSRERRAARRASRECSADIWRAAEGLIPGCQRWPEVSSSSRNSRLDNRRFDEALAILEDARALSPDAAWLERINLLTGRAHSGPGISKPRPRRSKRWRILRRILRPTRSSMLRSPGCSRATTRASWRIIGSWAKAAGSEEARGDLSARGRSHPGRAGKQEGDGDAASVSARISPSQAQRGSVGRAGGTGVSRRASQPRRGPKKSGPRHGKRAERRRPRTGRLSCHLDRRRRAEL